MGIIRKDQRKRMSNAALAYLEDAGYGIDSANEGEIIVLSRREGDKRKLHLFLHNQTTNYKESIHSINRAVYGGDLVSNIFYKDGKNFHVRLGWRANTKGNGRSLKRYTKRDLDRMLHLRELEKFVLQKNSPQTTLTYYQPETIKLAEGLRSYNMGSVILNYEHITSRNIRFDFARPDTARDYKIAQEITGTGTEIGFFPRVKGSKILVVNAPRYTRKK